ncbi:MAG: hypothetical protein R2865_12825 [Deinococcales bacterium]
MASLSKLSPHLNKDFFAHCPQTTTSTQLALMGYQDSLYLKTNGDLPLLGEVAPKVRQKFLSFCDGEATEVFILDGAIAASSLRA